MLGRFFLIWIKLNENDFYENEMTFKSGKNGTKFQHLNSRNS